MSATLRIDDIRFSPASRSLRATGLWGWIQCRLDGRWQIDGITVRRTADRRFVLSFPTRRDGHGIERSIIKPLDLETSEHIKDAIINHLLAEGSIR